MPNRDKQLNAHPKPATSKSKGGYSKSNGAKVTTTTKPSKKKAGTTTTTKKKKQQQKKKPVVEDLPTPDTEAPEAAPSATTTTTSSRKKGGKGKDPDREILRGSKYQSVRLSSSAETEVRIANFDALFVKTPTQNVLEGYVRTTKDGKEVKATRVKTVHNEDTGLNEPVTERAFTHSNAEGVVTSHRNFLQVQPTLAAIRKKGKFYYERRCAEADPDATRPPVNLRISRKFVETIMKLLTADQIEITAFSKSSASRCDKITLMAKDFKLAAMALPLIRVGTGVLPIKMDTSS